MKPYSLDLRKKIVESALKKGVPKAERPPDTSGSIALRSNVSASNSTSAAPL
jgi:hypothetical protein